MTKRGVPVKGQLRSHKMFAKSLEKYISVVDAAKIYSTSAWNGPAEVKMNHQKRPRFSLRSYLIWSLRQDLPKLQLILRFSWLLLYSFIAFLAIVRETRCGREGFG